MVEGYRPGVTARLGIDERKMRGLNPRLVYCSLTGYGQSGPLASDAGHDLNYIAIAGALGAFGPAGDVPSFPLNLLADFAGGSLFAAFGIVLALYARKSSGEGQYIDASMVDGSMSMMAMHFADWGNAVLPARGEGLLAGTAPCYRCYHCKDGRFVSVAALERRFFETLWATLGYPQPAPDHFDRVNWPSLTERFEATFAERSRDEWAAIFAGRDACVTPVLDPGEAMLHPHNRSRHPHLSAGSVPVAPLLSETPGAASPVDLADQTIKVLRSVGLTEDEARQARTSTTSGNGTGLAWPPV